MQLKLMAIALFRSADEALFQNSASLGLARKERQTSLSLSL